jgi:photosystem II stability/assembly factor-like uncharacterized protein
MRLARPLVLTCLLTTAAAADQWTAVSPVDGFGYFVIAADPHDRNILYADAADGRQLWKSDDAGSTWRPTTLAATVGFTTVTVESARPGGVTALYVMADTFVARSTTGGATWTTRQFFPPISGVANGVAVDAIKPDVLYMSISRVCIGSCTRGGVIKSTNGGNHWSGVLADVNVSQVITDPVTSDIVYATTPAGVQRSLDGGASWRAIGPPIGGMLLVDPTTGMTLYLFGGSSIYRSDDRGETWLPVLGIRPAAWEFSGFFGGAIHPNDRSTLVVNKGTSGVFRSRNGGSSWEALSAGLDDPFNPGLTATMRQVIYAADGTLWASSLVVGLHVLKPAEAAPPSRRRAIAH